MSSNAHGCARDVNASYWSAGAPARRPLWDVAGGPDHNRQRVARCQSYVSAERAWGSGLRLIDGARAESRLDFPGGRRSAARLDAARTIATVYGVETRQTGRRGNRTSLSLAVRGDAEDVARYIAGVPRVLDYAEALATQAARSYGDWSRHSMARRHLAGLDENERRSRAAQFRAAAFRVIVDVLVGGPDVVLPDVDASLAPWDQVRAVAGGIAQYGWVEVGAAYDPAQARKMLAEAEESAPFDELPVSATPGDVEILRDFGLIVDSASASSSWPWAVTELGLRVASSWPCEQVVVISGVRTGSWRVPGGRGSASQQVDRPVLALHSLA